MSTIFKNGIQHGWSAVEVRIFDRKIEGIVALDYEESQEKENLYGAGSKPIGRGHGRYAAKASITLLKFEVDALKESVGLRSLTEIAPFDIIVFYTLPNSSELRTDVLKNCEFLNDAISTKEGDLKIEKKLDLIVSHIQSL